MLEGVKSDIATFINKSLGAVNRFISYNRKGINLLDIFPREGVGEKVKSGNVQSMLDAFTGWVYDCVNVLATNIARVPMKVYKPTNYEDKLIKDHPFYKLIKKPNSYQNYYDFKYLMQAYLDIAGSCYIHVDKNRFNRPINLELLLPNYVTKRRENGNIVYDYTTSGNTYKFSEDEIIHIKYPNPADPLQGLSPLEAIRMPINLIYYMEQYLLSLMFNRARPDLLFTTEQDISEAETKRANIAWRKAHQGIDKAGNVAFMGKGLKMQTVSLSPTDVQFLESKIQGLKEISAAYNVPLHKLGELGDVNKANAYVLDLAFARDSLAPRLYLRDTYLTTELISMYDSNLIVKSENVIPIDKEFMKEQEEMDLKNGVITINEVRKRRNLEEVPYGDVIYMPFNLQPMGNASIYTESSKPKEEPKKIYKGFNPKLMSPELKERILKAYHRKVEPEEKLLIEKLKIYFEKQKNKILKLLRKYHKEYKQTEIYLPPLDEENEELWTAIYAVIAYSVTSGAEAIIDDMGMDIVFNSDTQFVKEFFKSRENLIKNPLTGQSVNQKTFNDIKITLQEGINNGETYKQLAGRVEGVFKQAKGPRAMKIARTETHAANSFSHLESGRQAGFDGKFCITAGDDKVRDEHVMNEAAGCIPTHELFPGTGEDFVGESEVNCRCYQGVCLIGV